LIHKCFCSRDTSTLLKAHVTYVRPVLEMHLSFGGHNFYTLKHESAQRHFTKRLPGCGRLSYSDRLTKLGLESLEPWLLVVSLSVRPSIRLSLCHTPV